MSNSRHHAEKMKKEEKERIKKEEKARAKAEKERLKEEKRNAKKAKEKKHEVRVVPSTPVPTPAPVRSSVAPSPSVVNNDDSALNSKLVIITQGTSFLYHCLKTQVTVESVMGCLSEVAVVLTALNEKFDGNFMTTATAVESVLPVPVLTEENKKPFRVVKALIDEVVNPLTFAEKSKEYQSKHALLCSYLEGATEINENITALPDSYGKKSELAKINADNIEVISRLISTMDKVMYNVAIVMMFYVNVDKCLQKPVIQPAVSAFSASGATMFTAKPAAVTEEVEEKADVATVVNKK